MNFTRFPLANQTLLLHPFKAIFWEEQQALLLADLHLGKAAHFRKKGIPVPKQVQQESWDKLHAVLLDFQPKQVFFLGDLFHSHYNESWKDFIKLLHQFDYISFELIKGNHDILPEEHYQNIPLTIHTEPFAFSPFLLSHHPMLEIPEGFYNLAGHIHPCVFLHGNGRQHLKLPCFYFGKQSGLLPAFGAFTGMATIQPQQGDVVFVIVEEKVLQVG